MLVPRLSGDELRVRSYPSSVVISHRILQAVISVSIRPHQVLRKKSMLDLDVIFFFTHRDLSNTIRARADRMIDPGRGCLGVEMLRLPRGPTAKRAHGSR